MDRLWAMEVFVRVAESGSFSRAAESLDLAKATVTTCVRNLETHLKVTLINRDTRRLRLTEEGQLYLRRAREMLEAVARAEDEIRATTGELRGRLHVETTISIGQNLLTPKLPAFARRHPGLVVAVSLSNQRHNLVERGIDLALRVGEADGPDLAVQPLRTGHYAVCCAPNLARTLPSHPGELDPARCIGLTAEHRQGIRPWPMRRGDDAVEIRPDGPLHFNNSSDALAAAREGIGFACVLDLLAAPLLADGSLMRVYADWETPAKTLHAISPAARAGSPNVRALTEFLREVM